MTQLNPDISGVAGPLPPAGSPVSPEKRAGDFRRLRALGLIPLDGDFYPVVHYPGITMYPRASEEDVFRGYTAPPGGKVSVYVHIPFCGRYCNFCHYPVKIGASDEDKAAYLAALSREAGLYRRRLGLDRPKATSVLVGGGTPTCLTPELLAGFLRDLHRQFDLAAAQFSFDVDPGTLLGPEGAERLKLLRAHGVGRLTIGIQSLDDGVLKRMNRAHDAAAALRAVEAARAAGFKLNLEFIYGYPGDTMTAWAATMRGAVKLGAEELQIYRIKLIPYGDHAGFLSRSGGPPRTPVEEVFRMKQAAILILEEAGYRENLRRVYSRDPADYSRYAHDQCCGLADQIGLGLTAFSSLRDRFVLPTQDLQEYYALIAAGKLPVNRGLIRDAAAQAAWAFVLPLKNRRVVKGHFRRMTGRLPEELFGQRIARLKEAGLLLEDAAKLELTPEGAFFADEVCHQFYQREFLPFGPAAYAPGPLNPYNA